MVVVVVDVVVNGFAVLDMVWVTVVIVGKAVGWKGGDPPGKNKKHKIQIFKDGTYRRQDDVAIKFDWENRGN